MNLGGGFAGGLTQGLQARQAMEERKASNEHSRNLQDRQMKMAEISFGNQQADRAAAEAQKKVVAAAASKYYGEHEVEDGEAFDDDGAGNITRIPIKKKVKFTPGMDPTRDLGFMGEMISISMSSGKYDPAQFKSSWEAVQKVRETELGNVIEGAIRGDKASINKFLTSIGESPDGATLDIDVKNGKFNIVTASGKPIDMMPAMLRSKQADAYLKAWETSSKVALNQSATRENDAQVDKLIPAQVAQARASAGNSNANAEYTRTAKTNLTNERAEAVGTKGSKIPTKVITDAIFDPGAQAAATTYAQSIAAKGKTPDVAAMEAVDLYQKIRAAAAKDPGLKAKGYTPDQAAAAKMKQMAGG